jgi:hypothetical protein
MIHWRENYTYAVEPVSEVTQEQIEQACGNAIILDFIDSLPEFVFIHSLDACPTINGCFIKFVADSTPKLVVNVPSCPRVRIVCQVHSNSFQSSWRFCPLELIFIGCALLRDPKYPLLDDIFTAIVHCI